MCTVPDEFVEETVRPDAVDIFGMHDLCETFAMDDNMQHELELAYMQEELDAELKIAPTDDRDLMILQQEYKRHFATTLVKLENQYQEKVLDHENVEAYVKNVVFKSGEIDAEFTKLLQDSYAFHIFGFPFWISVDDIRYPVFENGSSVCVSQYISHLKIRVRVAVTSEPGRLCHIRMSVMFV